MKKEVAKYVDKCLTCQKVKAKHQRPMDELRPQEISTWKWDSISTDFDMGLPLSALKKNAICVIVDQLTKLAHFLLIRDTREVEKLVQLYVRDSPPHMIPLDKVSDRDQRFQAHFRQALQKALGTKLNFNSSYHPETDGQTKKVNQILDDTLRACVLEFQVK